MINNGIAIVVVTYRPDIAILDQLKRIADMADCLVVVDNTPGGAALGTLQHPNVEILYELSNVGLAKALNDGLNYVGKLGYNNIFLLDQDSKPDRFFFESMLNFKNSIEKAISNCAFCVPNFFDRNSQSSARYPLLTAYTIEHRTCKNVRPYYTDKAIVAITSGMLITYERFQKIGPLPENYFIDFIDNEYCLRAAQKGLSVAVNCDATLNHAIGYREKRQLLGLQIKPNHHPPIRRYYISRNGVFTAIKNFRSYPSYSVLITCRFIHELLAILLYENDIKLKFKMFFLGLIHGLLGKMGKFKDQKPMV